MKNTIKTEFIGLAALGAILAFSVIGQSYAADGKMYAASSCVNWKGAVPFLSQSRLGNSSTSTDSYVDCPLVKDHIGYAFDRYSIRATDMHSSDSVTCRLYSVYRSGTSSFVRYGDLLSTGGAYFGSNEVEISGTRDVPTVSSAHSYFSCKIPEVGVGGTSFLSSLYAVEL